LPKKQKTWKIPETILSTKSTQKKVIDKAAAATEPKILLSHGANAHSHAIVVMQTSKANLHENVAIVVDMLLTKIRVQREEKPATLAEKLVILLMFVDQNLVPWPPWKLMKSPMKNTSTFTRSTIKKTGRH
jgi:pyruvate kinase